MSGRILLLLLLGLGAGAARAGPATGYAPVDGLQLYYELHGPAAAAPPLVLLPGGGSTIESTYGTLLPELARHRRVIALELQAHGHTRDIDRPLSFAQDADDVFAALQYLRVDRADVMGFSNGGTTALQVALRHPAAVRRLVLASAAYRRDGLPPGFFAGFKAATLDRSLPAPLREAYLRANPDPAGLQAMFSRDVARMAAFTDIPDASIKGITAPALVLNGDRDVVLPAHALALAQLLPRGRLAILPGAHGEYLGEVCTRDPANPVPGLVAVLIGRFLDAAD